MGLNQEWTFRKTRVEHGAFGDISEKAAATRMRDNHSTDSEEAEDTVAWFLRWFETQLCF